MAKILLIDDDELVRYSLAKALTQGGHSVIDTGNGRTGLKLLQKEEVDVIITDIVMPDMDGFEIILETIQIAPGLPIIAISGGGRIGAEDYLSSAALFDIHATFIKPVDERELIACVDRLVG